MAIDHTQAAATARRRIASSYDVPVGTSHGRRWMTSAEESPLAGERQFVCESTPAAESVPAGEEPDDIGKLAFTKAEERRLTRFVQTFCPYKRTLLDPQRKQTKEA